MTPRVLVAMSEVEKAISDGDRDPPDFIATSARKSVLYQEIDGAKREPDLPLASKADIKDMAVGLGLPEYIDLQYLPMQSVVVTLLSATKAPELHKLYPDVFEKKISGKPTRPYCLVKLL